MAELAKVVKSSNPQEAVLNNYALLEEIGILKHIDEVTAQLRDLEALVLEAGEVFNIQDKKILTEYIAQKLLNKFIPSHLAFIFQSELGSNSPDILCYENMKSVASPINIPSLEPYKHFFSLSPVSVDFAVFEYMVGQSDITDALKPLNPAKVIPIMGFTGVHGFIIVGNKVLGEPYTENETKYLERLINFASISFQNSLHYQSAITDMKTALYNHSFFMKRLEEELARVRRYKSQVTLLIFDIDHFKTFNDTYGHLAGDAVLAEVARVIGGSVRTEDVAARFGGEEFVVLLIQCKAEYGTEIGERIRKRVSELQVVFEGIPLSVTISVGIAEANNEPPNQNPESLIQHADKALYVSKEKGRNLTTVYFPGLETRSEEKTR